MSLQALAERDLGAVGPSLRERHRDVPLSRYRVSDHQRHDRRRVRYVAQLKISRTSDSHELTVQEPLSISARL